MVTLLGWIGALLALLAYAQTATIRLRQIALLSSVALLTFAVLLGIWSNVVLESALGIVNVRRLMQLHPRKRRRRPTAEASGYVNMATCPTNERYQPQPSLSRQAGRQGQAIR
jgi:hypothetical protein